MLSTKKVASALLATTMMLGAAVPAFATDLTTADALTSADNALEVSGSLTAPTIKVVLPTAGSMVMNPYQLKVQFTGDGETSNQDHTEQVLYKSQFIQNQSNVPMKVSVTVTGKLGADADKITFASAAFKGNETTKSVYLFLQQKVADAAAPDAHTIDWEDAKYNKATDVLIGTKAVKLENFATLDAATMTSGAVTSCSALAYRLNGSLTTAPSTAWTADDKIDVTIAYSFATIANTVDD